jgi:hypothetical protein
VRSSSSSSSSSSRVKNVSKNVFPKKALCESLGSLKISQIFFLFCEGKAEKERKRKNVEEEEKKRDKQGEKWEKSALVALCVFTFTPHQPNFSLLLRTSLLR